MNYKKYTQTIMALPHITNSQAGVNNYDAVFGSVFEVYFTLPAALKEVFGADEALLTEHVQSIGGLGTLDKGPAAVEQKFMGTTRSFVKTSIDNTSADLEVELTLNLRNETDNYIYKVFRAWSRLAYDISTGERHLKKDYLADWLKISVANAKGDIYREIVFKDVMMNGPVSGLNELSYDSADPVNLTVKFRSDWWKELMA
jgi:hypothetical protein